MSNKPFAVALLLCLASLAYAQNAPATFDDIVKANMELKLQELRNRNLEAKAKEAGPARSGPASTGASLPPVMPPSMPPLPPTPDAASQSLPPELQVPGSTSSAKKSTAKSEAPAEKTLVLVALYGMGTRLSAEIQYDGVSHTVTSDGHNSAVGPWTVEAVTPYSVSLVRPGEKQKGKKGVEGALVRKVLYRTSEVQPADKDDHASNPMGLPGMVGMPIGGFPGVRSGGNSR